MKKLIALIYSLFVLVQLSAQADSTERWFTGADIYTVTGNVYSNGVLGIKNGKISYVGPAENAPINGQAIDIKGKRIYPGLIALNSILGLAEIEAVRATNDWAEVGKNNAHIRAAIAFNTDGDVIPTVVSNGILLAQVCPRGATISGQSSVMKLQARNWEEALYKTDDAIHIYWGEFGNDDKENKEADERIKAIVGWLQQAKSYAGQKTPEINLKNEALREMLAGKKKAFVHVNGSSSIVNAIKTLSVFGITPVIVGGEESDKVTAFLKENNVPVIISRTHKLPANYDDSYESIYALPYRLWKDSVKFAISDINFWEQRNLPFQAGQAVAFGLPYEEALKAVTIYPAQLLDIDSTTGSLEVGKDANFIITSGDILDMRTSIVEKAYLTGKEVNLDTRQKALFEKYHLLLFGNKP